MEVEIEVVGLTAGADAGDDGFGEGVVPGLLGLTEVLDAGFLDLIGAGDVFEGSELGFEVGLGVVVGLEEGGVGGDLVAAECGFLVDDEGGGEGCFGDAVVGLLDEADGSAGFLDLLIEDGGEQKESDDRQDEDLLEDSVELL